MKTCNKCKVSKGHSEYHRCSRSDDNFKHTCRECRNKRTREYKKNKYNTDEIFRHKTLKQDIEWRTQKRKDKTSITAIKDSLRARLNTSISNAYKTGSAVSDLGCSIEELKKHLECQFQDGMTWSNRGLKGWHIDHIKPLDSFDLTNKEELKKAVHYSNLQPLWAKDNLKKSNKCQE